MSAGNWIRDLHASELQATVDKIAAGMLDRFGILAVAVICHPDQLGADRLKGYTVVLDPNQKLGEVQVR